MSLRNFLVALIVMTALGTAVGARRAAVPELLLDVSINGNSHVYDTGDHAFKVLVRDGEANEEITYIEWRGIVVGDDGASSVLAWWSDDIGSTNGSGDFDWAYPDVTAPTLCGSFYSQVFVDGEPSAPILYSTDC